MASANPRRVEVYLPLAIILSCGGLFVCYLVLLNSEYIRGDIVARLAQGRLESVYTEFRHVSTNQTLLEEATPRLATYACGLSLGSTQYAFVSAHQTYTSSMAYNDTHESFRAFFLSRNWTDISLEESNPIDSLFQNRQDPNLFVGLCQNSSFNTATGSVQYTVFFNFDETDYGCSEAGRDRAERLALRYCTEH